MVLSDIYDYSLPCQSRCAGWRATGSRPDRVDGRATQTVYYEHEGHRIGYTVVSGGTLAIPEDAVRLRRNGVDVALVRDGSDEVYAMFERGGRTCVLSGHVIHTSTLVKLAAWHGRGSVQF